MTRPPDAQSVSAEQRRLEVKLKKRFGFPSFRIWQADAIRALLSGPRRVLVVAPTGGGKSLCYQFPATELPGTTVVVSPLIALMEDQVRSLTALGIPATWLASTLEPDENRRRLRELLAGSFKLVYVAPERLAQGGLLEALRRLQPPLCAIDEAHCISQWGHDFRPDYLRLRDVLQVLQPRHVLACTATATPRVREEIVRLLGWPPEQTATVLRGFARPNLHLAVEEIDEAARRQRVMLSALRDLVGPPDQPRGAGIVYAATRRNVERVSSLILERGYRVAPYHAGLEPDLRARVNEAFATGRLDVVVATNAFGMGIDRPDIRAVIHVQSPGSLEEYYQEVGRAGRDGLPAHGLLLASSADMGLRRCLISSSSGAQAEHQWKLFLDLMRYVEAGSCRHDFILRYFGDEGETLGGCGHCDVCELLDDQADSADKAQSSADEALLVRKALAGVARARARVGLNSVADMLCGTLKAQQKRLGLDDLSTFGLLKTYPRPWVQALLRRLVTAGLADLAPGDYPVIAITPQGWAAMKGEAPLRLVLPRAAAGEARGSRKKKRGSTRTALSVRVTNHTLFERLRQVRLELARDKGVPAYIVCHDRTLAEIAEHRPSTRAELAAVHGMGPARLDAYGDFFLAAVQEG